MDNLLNTYDTIDKQIISGDYLLAHSLVESLCSNPETVNNHLIGTRKELSKLIKSQELNLN